MTGLHPPLPPSLRHEIDRLNAALADATRIAGPVGAAAQELATRLHPHAIRDEQLAFPPLGLLSSLARRGVTPAMRAVLPLTDLLKADHARLVEEHRTIAALALRMAQIARVMGHPGVVHLADALARHARLEEELLYPAALLVGDVVRARYGIEVR